MNRYMMSKEIFEILEMCRRTEFDLYHWSVDKITVLTKTCEVMGMFKEYKDYDKTKHWSFDLWISRDGPCARALRDEIKITIKDNSLSYHYFYRDKHLSEICKERAFDLLIEWKSCYL